MGLSSIEYLDSVRLGGKGNRSVGELRLELQKTMQKFAGVFRTQDLLEEGCEKVSQLYQQLHDIRVRNFMKCR